MMRRPITTGAIVFTVLIAFAFLLGSNPQVEAAQPQPQEQTGPVGVYEFETRVRFARDVRMLSDLTVRGDLNVAGTVSAGLLKADAQPTLTVAMNGYITPTGTFQPISSAAAVGTSNLALASAGELLVLVNAGANTITLTDTGTLKLAGNAAIGTADSLTLISDGTAWVEMARSNN